MVVKFTCLRVCKEKICLLFVVCNGFAALVSGSCAVALALPLIIYAAGIDSALRQLETELHAIFKNVMVLSWTPKVLGASYMIGNQQKRSIFGACPLLGSEKTCFLRSIKLPSHCT